MTYTDLKGDEVLLDLVATHFKEEKRKIGSLGLMTQKGMTLYSFPKDDLQTALEKTLSLIQDKTIIVYQGKSYDLPILNQALREAGLEEISDHKVLDLYLFFQKRRPFLPLDSLALSSLSEGDWSYDWSLNKAMSRARKEDPELLNFQEEELLRLYSILPKYRDLRERLCFSSKFGASRGNFEITGISQLGQTLVVDLQTDLYPSSEIHYSAPYFELEWKEDRLQISFVCLEETFPDGEKTYLYQQFMRPMITDSSGYSLPKDLLIVRKGKYRLANIRYLLQGMLAYFSMEFGV